MARKRIDRNNRLGLTAVVGVLSMLGTVAVADAYSRMAQDRAAEEASRRDAQHKVLSFHRQGGFNLLVTDPADSDYVLLWRVNPNGEREFLGRRMTGSVITPPDTGGSGVQLERVTRSERLVGVATTFNASAGDRP